MRKYFPEINLYNCLLLSSLLGTFAPVFSLFSLLGNEDLGLAERLVNKLKEKFGDFSLFEIINYIPSYHYGPDHSFPYILYIRFSIYGLCSLIVLIAFKNKLKLLFNKIECILKQNTTVYYFVLFFIFTYQSKMFFGWWFFGIGGWDFRDWGSIAKFNNIGDIKNVSSKLEGGLNFENTRKINSFYNKHCIIPGEIHLIYDDENKSYPVNLGLTEIVFPKRFIEKNELLLDLINYKVNNFENIQMLYPEHAPYSYFNFNILKNKKFVRYEVWDVILSIDFGNTYIAESNLNKVIAYD